MSARTIELNEGLYEYLTRVSLRESALMKRLRDETGELPMANMQIGPEQGQFMGLLAIMVAASRPAELGPPRFIEIGTFTGYSALAVACAVPNARVWACDVSEEWTAVAKRYWAEAGVADRIELHLRPGAKTAATLLEEGQAGTFDFAFIDADKTAYDNYYELCLKLLRPGGLITIDNVLWGGSVADESKQDDDTNALRAISEKLLVDDRVDISLVPIGDGLTLARKR